MIHKQCVFLGLGSNMGDREDNIRQAVRRVAEIIDTTIYKVSSVYETEPVGVQSPNMFLNAVIELRTSQSPFDLLRYLQHIENDLGRVRAQTMDPRPIDLDILIFGDLHINHPDLIIPHPQLRRRRFVLEPLCEIAAEFPINGNGQTVTDALLCCQDTHWVAHYTGPETIIPSVKEKAH